MRLIAGANDTDVVPCTRNVIFGVWGICNKRGKSRFMEIKKLKYRKNEKRKLLAGIKIIFTLGVCLLPEIALLLLIPSELYSGEDRLNLLGLYISACSLSMTVLIAFLIYWLQKSDENREQRHRQQMACTAMRYAIENGIRWMIGLDDNGMLGAAATIKETTNLYRCELLDVLSEQEYNEMILVVEGINDAIGVSRSEEVDDRVTEENRSMMFRHWINSIRLSEYRPYLAMVKDYHDLLSEMMINLLNALGGDYTFEDEMTIQGQDHKNLIEWDGKKTRIYNGAEVILDGVLGVDEYTDQIRIIDGWAKNDKYTGYYKNGKYDGQGCEHDYRGKKLKEGIWEEGELKNGMEYGWLICIDQGQLIYHSKENAYDVSENFKYSKYEQYGGDILPFMFSESCIEHEGLDKFYVTDLQVDWDMEQMVNIQPLGQYLEKKNPERLQYFKVRMGLENDDEDDSTFM